MKEIPGHGIQAVINGKHILVGNEKLLKEAGISVPTQQKRGTVIYVGEDEEYLGCIFIGDTIKDEAADAVLDLSRIGVDTVLLSGDNQDSVEEVAESLGIRSYYAELLPDDKVRHLERMLSENKGRGNIGFAGDGINDAPVLMRSDVGIAMGAMGSDAAIEAADVVLMDDNLCKIPLAIRISRKCMRIVKENIVFALLVKLLCLIFAAVGYANMWWAVFSDVGVMIIAVLNATRMLKPMKIER